MSELSPYTESRIDRYLSGLMSAEEQQDFEQQIAAQPELEQDVHHHLLAKSAAFKEGRDHWRAEKRRTFDRWETEDRRSRNAWMKIAATLLLLLMFGLGWYLQHPSQTSPEDLFANYYQVDTAPAPRKALPSSKLLEGYHAFNQGQYAEALVLWQNLPQTLDSFTQDELAYFKGLAYLELGKSSEAILALESIQTSAYQAKAHWYMGLIHIKEGDSVRARMYLSSAPIQTSIFHSTAQHLLEQLPE